MIKGNIGIHLDTKYCVEKVTKEGCISERLEFGNVVLDVGWENLKKRLMVKGGRQYYLFMGTGTSEPSRYDTGLESISETLGSKSRSGISLSTSVEGDYVAHKAVIRFDYKDGEAEGVWTELGLSFESEYTEPYNRSLFRDENGDPTSVTVLSDEYLRVFVTLYMYMPRGEVAEGEFEANGVTHTWKLVTTDHHETGGSSNNGNPWHTNSAYAARGRLRGSIPSERFDEIFFHNTDGYSLDTDAARVTVTIDRSAGDEEMYDDIEIHPDAFHGPNVTKSHDLIFDPPVVKPGDYRVDAVISWGIERAEVPE